MAAPLSPGCNCGAPVFGLSEERVAEILARGNLCTSDADAAALDRLEAHSFAETAASCGVGCATSSDQGECVAACLTEVAPSLSLDCSDCVTYVIGCMLERCPTECVPPLGGEPSSQACVSCGCTGDDVSISCEREFERCAGVPPPGFCAQLANR